MCSKGEVELHHTVGRTAPRPPREGPSCTLPDKGEAELHHTVGRTAPRPPREKPSCTLPAKEEHFKGGKRLIESMQHPCNRASRHKTLERTPAHSSHRLQGDWK